MGKYKRAIKKELKWLDEEIKLCNESLSKGFDNCINEVTIVVKKRCAEFELRRLNEFIKEKD